MYQCIRSKVLLNHEMSESFPCRLGVLQGECVSPFLFAMYVNDLESHLYSSDGDFKLMWLLYADDLVIFAETPGALQLQTDKLYNYCQKWKLFILINQHREIKDCCVQKRNQSLPGEVVLWWNSYPCMLTYSLPRIGFPIQWLIFQIPIHIGWSSEQSNFSTSLNIVALQRYHIISCARSLWQVDNPNSVLWLWGLGFPLGAGYWASSFVFL